MFLFVLAWLFSDLCKQVFFNIAGNLGHHLVNVLIFHGLAVIKEGEIHGQGLLVLSKFFTFEHIKQPVVPELWNRQSIQ